MKVILESGIRMYKGFEVGGCLMYLRNSKVIIVVGIEWGRDGMVGGEVFRNNRGFGRLGEGV